VEVRNGIVQQVPKVATCSTIFTARGVVRDKKMLAAVYLPQNPAASLLARKKKKT
jgi:hypothetical protein